MKILLLGSGGREHALAWKIAQSTKVKKLYIAPGNAGTAEVGENVSIKADDFDEIKKFVLCNQIDMVVVGPEDPLVKGIYDYFQNDAELKNIPVIGPSKQGAVLEGSKDFAKAFMLRHGIPTAAYQTFNGETLQQGKEFLRTLKAPYVLKADGLCAGKGVLILPTLEEAEKQRGLGPLLNSRGWRPCSRPASVRSPCRSIPLMGSGWDLQGRRSPVLPEQHSAAPSPVVCGREEGAGRPLRLPFWQWPSESKR